MTMSRLRKDVEALVLSKKKPKGMFEVVHRGICANMSQITTQRMSTSIAATKTMKNQIRKRFWVDASTIKLLGRVN